MSFKINNKKYIITIKNKNCVLIQTIINKQLIDVTKQFKISHGKSKNSNYKLGSLDGYEIIISKKEFEIYKDQELIQKNSNKENAIFKINNKNF